MITKNDAVFLLIWSLRLCSKLAYFLVIMLLVMVYNHIIFPVQKSNAAQIYSYNLAYFDSNRSIYYDPYITEENNKCLNGLLNRLPQKGDKETTEACLNTFGYNPDKKIKSPVMIIFEIGRTSQEIITTLVYKNKNGQINQEHFQAVGARYYSWYAPAGMYTLDYIKLDNSPSFKPAYGNFYSPEGETDKNGNPVNIGFHGREGNLMAGNGSNGCYRHHVIDMKRITRIIESTGQEVGLPYRWYEDTLPIAIISI
jgi:hypothetical protein